jgi:raffinose/stachyose/melibiose transport system permease protein
MIITKRTLYIYTEFFSEKSKNINKNGNALDARKTYPNYMMFIPLVVFIIFFLLPSTIGYVYAFTDWNPYVEKVSFVGLANFIELIKNKTLSIAFINTIIFAIVKTVVVTALGISIAVALNKKLRTTSALRTIYFFPAVLSALVVGLIFAALFDANNGLVNKILENLGLINWTQEWLGRRVPALIVINLAEIWRSLGYGIVITLAALQSIPSDYLESAKVDGSTGWQTFKWITLPLIMPAVNVNILFSLIYGLKMFDLVLILTRGGPGHDTETFGTLILSEMARDRYAQSVTVNLVFTIFLVIVALAYQKMSKKLEADL